ncbi:MAG: hypothetical protein CSB46_04675 [Micrococcales bacterium]|nr:MAG: hypothetical protein CSB46_04675 [Micrococcales bacterium]
MTLLPPAASIPPSCLHEVFRAAEAHERRTGSEVIKLHVGEPFFAPPPEASQAHVDAVRNNDIQYTSAEGDLALRQALTAKLRRVNGFDADPEWVFVSPGSCQGLAALMQSIAEPGAELLLPSLHWPVHLQQCLLAGLRPVFYPLDDQFHPDLERMADLGSANTRAILINSPANPTGAVLDRDELQGLLDLAHERGWRVISDEAYEQFTYTGEHISAAALERHLDPADRLVDSAFTFSKGAAMTGMRLGYIVAANNRAADALRIVQEASIIAPPTPVQRAGLAALGAWQHGERHAALVRQNRDTVMPDQQEAGLLRGLPEGGWYALLDVSSTGLDGQEFSDRLLAEHSVSLAPAAGFALKPALDTAGRVTAAPAAAGSRSLIRLAFCGDPGRLATGVERLLKFAAG